MGSLGCRNEEFGMCRNRNLCAEMRSLGCAEMSLGCVEMSLGCAERSLGCAVMRSLGCAEIGILGCAGHDTPCPSCGAVCGTAVPTVLIVLTSCIVNSWVEYKLKQQKSRILFPWVQKSLCCSLSQNHRVGKDLKNHLVPTHTFH